ncbi:MAG: hypothetical protein IJZ24_03610 [Clostridia bacterium]|nr:hypothetical protein [Clostridia bacterium]
MKRRLKKILAFFANPRLLLCLGLAWIITNGWSYILLGLGVLLDVAWMKAVASAYLAFLWIPLTPEKIVTVMIAIFLLRCFFPKDEKTLGILRDMFGKIKAKAKKTKKETEQKQNDKTE